MRELPISQAYATKPCLVTRSAKLLLVSFAIAGCNGCAHSPTISIFGSFFPTWLLCALSAVVLTFVVRAVCVRKRWDNALPFPVLFYLACAVAFAFAIYLAWLA